MSSRPPSLQKIDHIHVFVSDRTAAEPWYQEVFGLTRDPELEFWAVDGGPLALANPEGTIHLALFEGSAQPCRSTIAFAVTATDFVAWQTHLSRVFDNSIAPEDHGVAWSLYFSDPDGNPYEITSYDYVETLSMLGDRPEPELSRLG
ncbi:MAG: VOC family protein [Leptolyngbya sp. SIO1D8]|nr:VOC family protein [Leptolyngbya sp. SIO1D8]